MEKICSLREQFFPFRVAPNEEGYIPGLSLYQVHPCPLNRISMVSKH